MSLLRIGTKVRTIDRGARVHGRLPDKPEAIGIIRDHHRPFGRQSEDRSPPYYVVFKTGEDAWYDADEVERFNGARTSSKAGPQHATKKPVKKISRHDYDTSTGEGQKRLMRESAGHEYAQPHRIDVSSTADYGADPLGPDEGGVFRWRMVPSGDIVEEVERSRRLPSGMRGSHAVKKPPSQPAPTKARLNQDIATVLAEGGQPQLAALFADPQARKTFAREMRHEIQKQALSQAGAAHRAARPFTVKGLTQMDDRKFRETFGHYATEAEARAKADQIDGWVETRDGRVIYGIAREP